MKMRSIIFILFAVNIIFAQTYKEYQTRFINIRTMRDTSGIKVLMSELENELQKTDDTNMNNLLAETYFEYGLWGKVENNRPYYEKSFNMAEKIIRKDNKNGKAYYIASMACAQLIPMSNIFGIIKFGRKFMEYMPKAVELLEDPFYEGLALMGCGIGYMSPPPPFNDFRKSEEFYNEAQKYVGDYPGLYLYQGMLYMKTKDKEKAKNMFEKVISMEPHPFFIKAHEEDVARAKELLKDL